MTAAGNLRGGIDLGGTKIQTAIVGARGKISRPVAPPDPDRGRTRGRRAARWPRRCARRPSRPASRPRTLVGVGVGSPGDADEKTGVVSAAKNLPGWEGSFPARREPLGGARHRGPDRQRRPGGDRGGVPSRRRQALRLADRGLLGDRRRRRPDPRRQAVAGPGRGGRDRPYGGEAKRGALPLRTAGLPGGLCGTRGDGGQGPARARGRRRDGPVQDHEAPRPGPADQRRLGARPAR